MSSSISSLLVIFALWLVMALFCCAGGRPDPFDLSEITYRVDGIDRASLTYTNATGGTEQHNVQLPWTITFQGRDGEHLYLSAQDRGDNQGIVVSISINGRVVKDAASTEQYGIATVSAVCCK